LLQLTNKTGQGQPVCDLNPFFEHFNIKIKGRVKVVTKWQSYKVLGMVNAGHAINFYFFWLYQA